MKKIIVKKKLMKKLCLKSKYCCSGEIYKLLNTTVLDDLIINIKKPTGVDKKILKFNHKNIYEIFLENLDKYIGYVRDNYNIVHYELPIILEETLKNEYNKILLTLIDIHKNPSFFTNEFRKMFLHNLVDKTNLYANIDIKKEYRGIQKIYDYLKNKNLDDKDDLLIVEKLFKKIINNRQDNLYSCFKKIDNLDKISFYMEQLNWLYEEFYKYDI